MTKRLIVTLAALAVILGAIFGWKAWQDYRQSQARGGAAPPATVTAIHAEALDWQPTLNAVGSLRAVNGVSVTTQLAGLVAEIHFKSGETVKKDELLVQLQDSPEQAKLASLKAQVAYAKSEYERDQRLQKSKSISEDQVQQARSHLDDLKAQAREQQATIDLKAIRAPFAGVAGIRQVDLGEYVSAGRKIVTLQALDPLLVEFSLPQGQIGQVHEGQTVTVSADAWPDRSFEGKVNAINPKVDQETRSVAVQAEVPNPVHELLPGMFVETQVQLPPRSGVVTLPETAISHNPYGDYVYVLQHPEGGGDGWVAHQVVVRTGATRGSQIEIRKGVKPGDYVVTTGQLKLHDGATVTVNNEIQPDNEKNPTPPDA